MHIAQIEFKDVGVIQQTCSVAIESMIMLSEWDISLVKMIATMATWNRQQNTIKIRRSHWNNVIVCPFAPKFFSRPIGQFLFMLRLTWSHLNALKLMCATLHASYGHFRFSFLLNTFAALQNICSILMLLPFQKVDSHTHMRTCTEWTNKRTRKKKNKQNKKLILINETSDKDRRVERIQSNKLKMNKQNEQPEQIRR